MKQARGEEAFDQYFSEVYGDRWKAIKEALVSHEEKVGRVNAFFQDSLEQLPGISSPHDKLKSVYNLSDDFDINVFDSILLPVYRMDPASLFPAKALSVQPGETVLDMCAAPGGKSLVLIEALALSGDREGVFVANEMSARRRHRMMSVFKRYLPQDVRRMVQIRGVDGAVFGLEKKNHFDRMLLDAPCSGERGVIQKKSELALWKPKRSKSFGIRQYSLLSSAFMALKHGGRLVYST
ncbi:MAG: RsmB/NOP family class I SAM-dependent RNA methyltransferase, partial [Bdellovibrionales bacterium]|nr:RsmB/NOP family class I SAM-dependent RNA methyltransferase [Bdellovibrionales bacterium]